MQIKIHNLQKLPTIDYRDVNPLQGNLKDLTEEGYSKLVERLKKRGFRIPLFLWKSGEEWFLLDGHQRQIVMSQEDMNDNGNYEVPYVQIYAKDISEAKELLLEIISQYGKLTYEGLDEFIETAKLPEAELPKAVSFDALPLFTQDKKEPKSKKRQILICPGCQFEGEMKDYQRRYEDKLSV